MRSSSVRYRPLRRKIKNETKAAIECEVEINDDSLENNRTMALGYSGLVIN